LRHPAVEGRAALGRDGSYSRLTTERDAASHALFYSVPAAQSAAAGPATASRRKLGQGILFKHKNSPDREAGANRRHDPSPRPEDLSVDEHRQPSPPSWLASGSNQAHSGIRGKATF